MIEFLELPQEMRVLAVLVKTGLSEFGFEYAFLKGRNIEPIGKTSTFEEPVSQEIRSLINNDQLIMVIYFNVEDDFRPEILGVKIGKPPLFGHTHPLFLIYFDGENNCYAIYINSAANFLEIASPLAYILEKLEKVVFVDLNGDQMEKLDKVVIVDLFGYQWGNYRQLDTEGKSKRVKKGHLLFSNYSYRHQLSYNEVLISYLKFIFNRICKVSDNFMTEEFCFTFNDQNLRSLFLDDHDKEYWDEILEQISE